VPDKFINTILLGYSGHGYVVAEAAMLGGIRFFGYAETKELMRNPYQLVYLGDENQDDFDWGKAHSYILGVGSNKIRVKIAEKVRMKGGKCLTIIHPHASVSSDLILGSGSFIARNAAVNPMVQIGHNVILNTSCSIDHECTIGNNVHIAPGAVLAGNVTVHDSAFIGANSVVKEGLTIGENAIIGAGSVILKNVEANTVVVGNPAKLKN
jgi:sugar O-acyltransferase (sialic acid O-acetyltransferase NeuD family)